MATTFFNPLQMALKPLWEQAQKQDALFAQEVKTKTEAGKKSFAECCEWILGEAYEYASKHKDGNKGYAGMSDADMIGMIKHYYDEDGLKPKSTSGAVAKVAKTEDKKATTAKTATKTEQKKATTTATATASTKTAEQTTTKPNIPTPRQKSPIADKNDGQLDLFSPEFWASMTS